MLSIDTLTVGNEFKTAQGEIYQVTSNFSDKDKIFIELHKADNEVEELIKET